MSVFSWTPCNVKFPEEDGYYLVTIEDDDLDAKNRRGITLELFSTIYGWACPSEWRVHAWCKIPEIYEHDGYADFHEPTIEELMEEMEDSE